MNVLGLDPGTDCGWALYHNEMYLSGTWHLHPKGSLACGDHPLLYLRGHLRRVFQDAPVDLVILEEPIGYVQSIGRTITAVAAGSQKIGIIIAECAEKQCHWAGRKPNELKRFARERCPGQFGKGAGTKDDMFNAAKEYFGKVPSDYDEADALWVCAYGKENYEIMCPDLVPILQASLDALKVK